MKAEHSPYVKSTSWSSVPVVFFLLSKFIDFVSVLTIYPLNWWLQWSCCFVRMKKAKAIDNILYLIEFRHFWICFRLLSMLHIASPSLHLNWNESKRNNIFFSCKFWAFFDSIVEQATGFLNFNHEFILFFFFFFFFFFILSSIRAKLPFKTVRVGKENCPPSPCEKELNVAVSRWLINSRLFPLVYHTTVVFANLYNAPSRYNLFNTIDKIEFELCSEHIDCMFVHKPVSVLKFFPIKHLSGKPAKLRQCSMTTLP